jgi:heptosyltransferase III
VQRVLDQLPLGAGASVVRLRSLGDCVLTTPALSLLRAFRPDLHLAVVVEDRFAAVFQGNPDVDTILPPSGRQLAAWHPQLCLNLHGGTRSLALTAASRARFTAGFSHFRNSWLYKVRIPRAQQILGEERTVHTAEHLASAMFYLGVPRREIPRARLYPKDPPRRPAFAMFHPFASTPGKAWTTAGFVEVGRAVRRSLGLDVVVLGGADDDLTPYAEFECLKGAPLEEVKSVLYGASLFVGNDSGPAHMACALQVPLVVLYGESDPVVWAPWRATVAETIVATGPGALAKVPATEVLAAIDRLRVRA